MAPGVNQHLHDADELRVEHYKQGCDAEHVDVTSQKRGWDRTRSSDECERRGKRKHYRK